MPEVAKAGSHPRLGSVASTRVTKAHRWPPMHEVRPGARQRRAHTNSPTQDPLVSEGIASCGQRSTRSCERRLAGILVVGPYPQWQLHPGMFATVVNRISRWRKTWIGEGADGDRHRRLLAALFGVEYGCAAARAETEPKLGPLVTSANVIGRRADDLIGGGEARQRCKYTARAALTGKAVANPDSQRFALNLNAQLAAATRGCSRRHRLSPGKLFVPPPPSAR